MSRLVFILVCVFWVSASWSGSLYSDKYNLQIRKATELYLPTVDWRLLKAQYYQESLLNPKAKSHVGASGIAQFMPATWKAIARELRITGSPYDPSLAIPAGAYYMHKLRKGWSAKRPESDRHSLAMASYNAGFGNLLKAQKKCGGKSLYKDIIECLPRVTGRYSKETIAYVRRIWTYYIRMVVGV